MPDPTTPPSPDQVAAWRALAEAASEGPWDIEITAGRDITDEYFREVYVALPGKNVGPFLGDYEGSDADAAFIAAAREAVPALCDALDAANESLIFAATAHSRAIDERMDLARKATAQRDALAAEIDRVNHEFRSKSPERGVWDCCGYGIDGGWHRTSRIVLAELADRQEKT